MLLRLAVAENEDFSNNATGTWISLFGTMLPATAAGPEMRVSYLADAVRAGDPRIRALFVKAAHHALDWHETIMASAERQGGIVVEPRGTPATYGEAWSYRNSVINLLRTSVTEDPDPQVAEAALEAMISAIHPSLEVPALRNHLAESLGSLNGSHLRKVRKEIESLRALFGRVTDSDRRRDSLEEFAASLPSESAGDRLWALSRMHSWDREDGELEQDIEEAATALGGEQGPSALLRLLADGEPSAAFEIGRVLARLASERWQYIGDLRPQIDGPNNAAIVGYLWQATEAGDASAFDEFIDGLEASAFRKVELTVRGPDTAAARQRVDRLVDEMTVADGARLLFRWMREATADQLAQRVGTWRVRMSTQQDYNAVVDLLALWVHGRRELVNDQLLDTIASLLAERRRFPHLGQQAWDWSQLASMTLDTQPAALANLLLDLLDDGALSLYDGSNETEVLKAAITRAGPPTWKAAMDRIGSGSWHLVFSTRGWLADCVDIETAMHWVGDDIERARTLASVASLGGEHLTEVARFLLTRFSADQHVAGSLYGEFVSGTWWGSEAERIGGQIGQVRGWMDEPGLAKTVRKWLRELIVNLEASQARARQREAEDRF